MGRELELDPRMVAQFGQGGVTCTSGAATVTGRFYYIKCVTATVFTSISENGRTGTRVLTRLAGDEIYGDFTGYVVTSGDVEGYSK